MVAPTSIPDEFICPITMEIMVHPLVTRYGHNFEREAIIDWVRQGNDCPVTRQPLSFSSLIHNNQLAIQIQQWQIQNGVSSSTKLTLRDEENKPEDDCRGTHTMSYIYGTAALPFKAKNASHAESGREQDANRTQNSRVTVSLVPFRLRRQTFRIGRQRN